MFFYDTDNLFYFVFYWDTITNNTEKILNIAILRRISNGDYSKQEAMDELEGIDLIGKFSVFKHQIRRVCDRLQMEWLMSEGMI